MRGEILYYDDERGIGFIGGDDGNRYHFAREDLSGQRAPGKGVAVGFTADGNRARQVVPDAPPAPARRPAPPRARSVPELAPSGPPSLWRLYRHCLTSAYASFSGRAPRREYWGFVLFFLLVFVAGLALGVVLDAAAGNLDGGEAGYAALAGGIVMLGHLLPLFAVTVRRIHDIGLSGWFVLLGLVPTFGNLIILAFSLVPSQRHDNRWGPAPG